MDVSVPSLSVTTQYICTWGFIVYYLLCLSSATVIGVCEQRVGDQYWRRRQLWWAGTDIWHPKGGNSQSQDQCEAMGHRQRQLQENTYGKETFWASFSFIYLVAVPVMQARFSSGKHFEEEEDVWRIPQKSVHFRWVYVHVFWFFFRSELEEMLVTYVWCCD